MASVGTLPEAIRTAVRNNGGGHYNHSLFWKLLAPAGTAPIIVLPNVRTTSAAC